MKHRTLRGLQLLLGLVLFAAGSGQPGGLDLVVQQIEIMGARQWLGLMAGSVIAPVSQRVAGGFAHSSRRGQDPQRQRRLSNRSTHVIGATMCTKSPRA